MARNEGAMPKTSLFFSGDQKGVSMEDLAAQGEKQSEKHGRDLCSISRYELNFLILKYIYSQIARPLLAKDGITNHREEGQEETDMHFWSLLENMLPLPRKYHWKYGEMKEQPYSFKELVMSCSLSIKG